MLGPKYHHDSMYARKSPSPVYAPRTLSSVPTTECVYGVELKIGGMYLPSCEHYNFACDARYSGRGWACTLPPPTLKSRGWLFHHDGIYARKWPLPLCVLSVMPTKTDSVSSLSNSFDNIFRTINPGLLSY
jgi:hypothetical protein